MNEILMILIVYLLPLVILLTSVVCTRLEMDLAQEQKDPKIMDRLEPPHQTPEALKQGIRLQIELEPMEIQYQM